LPWQFGEAVERAVVDVLRLRYRLMPYIYTASVRAAESGVGVLRPLVLAAPHEPPTWAADLEYLFGPDLLVAPVTDPTGTRHVYLPSGSWVDYWSGEVFAGGRHISVTAPLDRIPLFVRHHALIPMTEDREIVGDTPFRSLIVACWGRAGGTVDVLGPDGTTRIAVTCDRSRVEATSAGPGRLRGLAFPPVGGAVVEQVHINGVRAELRPVDGWPTAMVDRDDQR
jgi:alpha-D-xyloside xylohydrolase